jgi:uncharacterized protein (TIGR03546 family)
MFGIEILAKIIKVLRASASPPQIAAGFVLGMIIGLTPFWSLHNLIVLILIVVVNVNITSVILSYMIFSLFAYIFDPLFHSLGYFVLVDISELHGLWTALYNIPIVALSNFNNTVLMGSLLVSLILLLPVYFLIKTGVIAYRENIDAKIQKWKIVNAIKGSKIYSWYEKLKSIGE